MNIYLLSLIILIIKIFNVALGTLRTIISVKDKHLTASIIGFVEIFIWFIIVREALNTPQKNIIIAISYSLGSAIGTYLGGFLSKKFINLNFTVQIITNNLKMANLLRKEGYGVTSISANGKDNKKNLLFIEINNRNLINLKSKIKEIDKNAFIIINETKYVYNGFMH